MSKRDEFVEIAQSQVGVRETGVNNVKYNDWYYGRHVEGASYPWCAVFVSWCANEVGILDSLVPKMAYVPYEVDWYKKKGLYHTSNYTPKKGDLAIFTSQGHIGIVERYDGNTHTIEGNKSDMVKRCNYSTWGSIIGYCEVPFGDSPSPTPQPITGLVAEYQRWLNNTYATGIEVDNQWGSNTKRASIKALQKEFNAQFGSKLDVDGYWGPKTKKACPNLKRGAKGNITKNVQFKLMIKGYGVGQYGADGTFGKDTENAIRTFQRNNGLSVDGICGPNTFEKLFN
jgi:hypothetical protein